MVHPYYSIRLLPKSLRLTYVPRYHRRLNKWFHLSDGMCCHMDWELDWTGSRVTFDIELTSSLSKTKSHGRIRMSLTPSDRFPNEVKEVQ